MTCREFIHLLAEYVDGELDHGPRRLCEEHLELCRSCANYLDSYRSTTELGRRVYQLEQERPVELPEELVQTILAVARPPA
ncbi:MAG: zf-HC2 domain-containing protein [Holophagales bacterium]|nr:zf-HC2 domain-containing protein [Holophagales bacterium]